MPRFNPPYRSSYHKGLLQVHQGPIMLFLRDRYHEGIDPRYA